MTSPPLPHGRDPRRVIRIALGVTTVTHALLCVGWTVVWLQLAARGGGIGQLLANGPALAFAGLCLLPSTVAAAAAWRRPRATGRILIACALASGFLVWRYPVPAFGGEDALRFMPLVMISLGSGWLALSAPRLPPSRVRPTRGPARRRPTGPRSSPASSARRSP